MKRNTIKFRITVWITIITALLSFLMIGFMLFISSSVVERTAEKQLWQTVKNNAAYITVDDKEINLTDEFHFYQNGVSVLIYSGEKSLLAGQIPVSFDVKAEFKNGEIRKVSSQHTEFLILDVHLPISWEYDLWVRGLMEAPDNIAAAQNFLHITMVSMPLFIFMAALGTFYILNKAFKPLDSIIATASSINEAKDLSCRIDIPKGKDEFSVLARVFNKLFSRLERSFEAEKQFISDASHELRTPISVIKSACDYSEKYDTTTEEYKESVGMIHRQADKMSDMVTQLLNMSRIDQGTENIKMEKLDLSEFVTRFCSEHRYERISVEVEPDIIVFADKLLMSRLLQNLIENAYKYGKKDGSVWVTLKTDNDRAILSVRDDGIGIAQEHHEKIWQRFYQVDSSRSEDCGSGLGLSMVQKIAELHMGTMTLKSAPGEGSCFSLIMPLYKK